MLSMSAPAAVKAGKKSIVSVAVAVSLLVREPSILCSFPTAKDEKEISRLNNNSEMR